ncbi:hypothetical protein N7452_007973 [Penicillium brevicompactum]|uniref:Uncharacterized protein n=1 Tax=Penicillium brevicompactum TaxID=5074 RepID=A0A9W9QGB2_PENBR|nr:hypothetical protein N7452_007973 [Penicillium brevicompactum]
MHFQLPILLALVTLAVAFPKWDKHNKKGGSSDGKDGDGDHKDDPQPWDGDKHDGNNRTICISIPDEKSWSAISPSGDKHSFDELKWDSGSGSSDGNY